MGREMEDYIRNLSDKNLLIMLQHPDKYVTEALDVANDEIEKRGGQEMLTEYVQPEIEKDKQVKEKDKYKLAMAIAFLPSLILFCVPVAVFGSLANNVKAGDFFIRMVAYALISFFLFFWVVIANLIAKLFLSNKQ